MKTSGANPLLCLLRGLCACGLLAAAGCGGLKCVPVAGKATVDGQPLTRGVVTFNPDPAKGNNARVACTGPVKGDGQYELYTDDGSHVQKGAPVGWYKVTIATTPGDDSPLPVHNKYTDFTKTDLAVEVTSSAGPGAYDLKFSK
jgi:hypothetical protein